LQHVEILARFPLPLLLIKVNVVIGPPAADLDRFFQVSDELPKE
jgi:hypothetical protein